MLRYETVKNNMQNFICSCQTKLIVAGYTDNSLKVFDLDGKLAYFTVNCHSARISCIKLSQDFNTLLTCDTDGVINHFIFRQNDPKPFPYKQICSF